MQRKPKKYAHESGARTGNGRQQGKHQQTASCISGTKFGLGIGRYGIHMADSNTNLGLGAGCETMVQGLSCANQHMID